jgi:hypothetical protein
MNNYTWKIVGMKSKQKNNIEDCVTEVEVLVTAENDGRMAEYSSIVILEDPDPDNFTPFNELTEEIVIGWMKNSLEFHVQDILTRELESQETTSPVKTNLPWLQ